MKEFILLATDAEVLTKLNALFFHKRKKKNMKSFTFRSLIEQQKLSQSQFGQQTVGNSSGMQWIYQQMLQVFIYLSYCLIFHLTI